MSVTTRRHEGKEGGADADADASLELDELFSRALLPMTVSRTLGPRELGAVGSTCLKLRDAAKEDELWYELCQQRWPGTMDDLQQQVLSRRPEKKTKTSSEGGGFFRWLYRQRCKATKEWSPPPPVPPPILNENICILLVDIIDEKKSHIIHSKSYTGDALRDFLLSGELEIRLDEPFPSGAIRGDLKIDRIYGGVCLDDGIPVLNSMSAKVQLVRYDNGTFQCATLLNARSSWCRGNTYRPFS